MLKNRNTTIEEVEAITLFRRSLSTYKPILTLKSLKEKEWYQIWWVGRIFAALSIGELSLICTWWFSAYHPFSGFLIGFLLSAAILFYLGNPERRFYKAATMALFSALGLITLQLGFRLEWVQKVENGNIDLFFEYTFEYDWLIAILLVLISAFLFYLDYKKDKGSS
ncbi:MAG: hypothetical protein ACI94Y_002260 [Maribacter sp.]